MFFSKTIVALASVASAVYAQDSTYGAPAPQGSVAVHVIKARNSPEGRPVFEPQEVNARVGDLIQFQFWPMNHSVVQSSFADPCIPLQDSAAGNGTEGFYSGFMPVGTDTTVMPTFTIDVKDERPIWFYCSQGRHCQNGMVGVINPTLNRTLADYQARAANAPANLSPGQEDVGNGAAPTTKTADFTAAPTGYTPTTLGTSATGVNAPTGTGANAPVGTGAAPKSAASISLVFAGLFASLFLL